MFLLFGVMKTTQRGNHYLCVCMALHGIDADSQEISELFYQLH